MEVNTDTKITEMSFYMTAPSGEKREQKISCAQGFDTDPLDYFKKKMTFRYGEDIGLPPNFMGPDIIHRNMNEGPMRGEQLKDAMTRYHSGEADLKYIEDNMTRIVGEFRQIYTDRGFDPELFTKQLIEDVYDSARFYNVYGAYVSGLKEAFALAAEQNGHGRNTKDWIYYDSELYYSGEEMKESLKDIAQRIAVKYGVSPSELELETEYPDGDIRKGMYSSYNTLVCFNAREDHYIGSFLDERMAPPKGLKFFYKDNDSGRNKLMPLLPAPTDDFEGLHDSVLKVWYGDWSFTGRVPVRMNAHKFPDHVNMFDVINKAAGGNMPSEIIPFCKNVDYFSVSTFWHYEKSHPRIF